MKYVLLLSGGVNDRYNYDRYASDLAFARQVMDEYLGTTEKIVQILYADGRRIRYLGQELETKPASRKGLYELLDEWKEKTTVEDESYFIVSNHGSQMSVGSVINLWGREFITLQEWTNEINAIKGHKYIVFGQCHGGDILKLNVKNADVLTANQPGYPSYTRIYPEMITYQGITYKYDYDEFLYHFFAALHGSYPSGKPLEEDTDKKYTFADAYEYARLNDVWNPLHPDHEEVCKIVSLPSAIEIPQMQVFM